MEIRIGTAEPGGTFYTQGEALAELFSRRAGAGRCLLRASAASIHNAELLDAGELEFGFMAANWIGRAYSGIDPFAQPIALRMVAPVNTGPIFFITLATSALRTVGDFIGRRIAVGAKGSGMEQHARTIFGALGLSFESFTPVNLSFAEGAEALCAGTVDAQFQPPIPNRVVSDLSRRAELRVVGYAPGELEKVLAAVPFYRRVTMERNCFRGVTEDVRQVGVVNVLVTHERVLEETVYGMARAIAGNVDALPQMNALFRGINDLFAPLRSEGPAAFAFGGVPLHNGAARAYREGGWIR